MSLFEEIPGEARKDLCAAPGVIELLSVAPGEREKIAEVRS